MLFSFLPSSPWIFFFPRLNKANSLAFSPFIFLFLGTGPISTSLLSIPEFLKHSRDPFRESGNGTISLGAVCSETPLRSVYEGLGQKALIGSLLELQKHQGGQRGGEKRSRGHTGKKRV